jgi:hypothetical protein
MCYYIAIDPGQNTGWAEFDEDGSVAGFGKMQQDEFFDWFEKQEFKVLIIEIYRNRPGAINMWSKGETQQHIGVCKRIAAKKHARVYEQEPSPCLAIGLRFLGVFDQYKGKHVPDEISALAHGTYFLRKNKVGIYA